MPRFSIEQYILIKNQHQLRVSILNLFSNVISIAIITEVIY
jgi:hypothetical protein